MTITFTTAAQTYLAELLAKQDQSGTGVRLFVLQPGTPHAETCLAYCQPGEQKATDRKLALAGFACHVDATSESYLKDAVVDFAKDALGGQLTIKAPNAKVATVDEHSPLPARVNYVLQTEINPNLAAHGGMVSLVEMDDGIAVLQFGGGCQGCGMIDVTLKQGVERTLLEHIPELQGIRDVTDHTLRQNAYYK